MSENLSYKSCFFIQGGLQFNQSSVSLCYQRACKGGGYGAIPIIDNFKGENIDIETINEYKKQIIEDNKNNKISSICDGCVELIDKEWGEFTGQIGVFNLDYWTYCNSNCIYCYTYNQKAHYNTQYTYSFLNVLKDLKSKNLIKPNGFVNFGGGEVALLDEFTDIIKIFEEHNYEIMVHTSAMDFIPILKKSLRNGNARIVISVDAGSEEMHAKVKNVRTFKKVWKNISKYAKVQKRLNQVKIKYIVIPGVNDNKNEIILWLDNVLKSGVKSVCMEIESAFFETNREFIQEEIYQIFIFGKEEAEKRNLKFTLYDRASHMMSEHPEYSEKFSGLLNNQ